MAVKTTVPRPLANQLEGPGDKSVANIGGGGGIRTHDTLAGITVFKTVAISLSATPPEVINFIIKAGELDVSSANDYGRYENRHPVRFQVIHFAVMTLEQFASIF